MTQAGAAIAALLLLFAAGGAMAQVNPIPAGAAAHWTFDRTGSDASGNGRDLALIGSPGFTDAGCGQAIVLDGTQWAERPVDDQAFDFGPGDFTISAWINVDDATQPRQMIVSKWAPTTPTDFDGWYLIYTGDGGFVLSDGRNTALSFRGSVVTGAWHHIVLQRNGTTFAMYLDSVLIGPATSSVTFDDPAQRLHIGQRSGFSPHVVTQETFRGKIDDLAIWDRALSAEERRQMAARCQDGADPPLPAETSLRADPVVPSLFQLRARLTDRESGAPLRDQLVTMSTAAAGQVCRAATNADGVATCDGLPAALSILLENGYTAAFPGSSNLGPASSRATLLAPGATSAPTPGRRPVPEVTPRPAGPPSVAPTPTSSSRPSGAALPATGGDDQAMPLGLALLLMGGALFRATRRARLS